MGAVYVPMRPKPHADLLRIGELADAQAAAFGAAGYGDQAAPDASAARLHYRAVSEELRACLDVVEHPDGPDAAIARRVAVIAGCTIFPIEWQRAAFRSYLPDQLAAQLAVWRAHVADVRRGLCRGYLLQRYLYEAGVANAAAWESLRTLAQRSRGHPSGWASKAAHIAARAAAEALPAPAPLAAPLWDAARMGATGADDEQRYTALQRERQALAQCVRDWNRTVPHAWRQQRWPDDDPLASFSSFAALAEEAWLGSFFIWAGRCCDAGLGLFLDY